MSEVSSKDPMVARLRRAAIAGADWLHDVADRLEQLQMPHAEVIKLAEVSDDGADSAALTRALCLRIEGQRKHIATLQEKLTVYQNAHANLARSGS